MRSCGRVVPVSGHANVATRRNFAYLTPTKKFVTLEQVASLALWGAKAGLDLLKLVRDNRLSRPVVAFDSSKTDKILPQLERWADLSRLG